VLVNEIPEKLSQESYYRLWAASGHQYTLAKRVLKGQMLLVALVPVALSFIAIGHPLWKPWVALYSVLVAAFDAVFPYYVLKALKETAARIQELFDCELLSIEWHERRAGRKPSEENISGAHQKNKKSDSFKKRLTEWYPAQVARIPLPVARILCQRANVAWDAGLRRRYARGVVAVLVILVLSVVFAAFWLDMNLRDFVLSVLSPALPLFMWLIREYIRQKESADTVEKIRGDAEELWDRVMAGNLTEAVMQSESRHLQDRIFDHRKTNTPILDLFYELSRSGQENSMVEATGVLVNRYLDKHPENRM
jgi:hypothetical protein